jgi:hypothetical protein
MMKLQPLLSMAVIGLSCGSALAKDAAEVKGPTGAPPVAADRVQFKSPKEIADQTKACLAAAKQAATPGERRIGRNKCLAEKRREFSRLRKQIKLFRARVAAWRTKARTERARCAKFGDTKRAERIKKWWKWHVTSWSEQVKRYARLGGERPTAEPPKFPEKCE